jgi:hypothetical protein
MKQYTIILILISLLMNIGFSSRADLLAQARQVQLPVINIASIYCRFFPNLKTKITNPDMPKFSIKIPCNWNYKWSLVNFLSTTSSIKNYQLTINSGTVNRLTLLFLYYAAGCAGDSCYQVPTPDYTTIGKNRLREKAQDPNVYSWFPTIAHDVHYHQYVSVLSPGATTSIRKIFPYGIGQTNHISTEAPIRIVYAVGQKTNPAFEGLLDMDDAIKSVIY